jgi:transposase
MEGINNATRCQIVINFYQKNQAKGKPYIIEYFRKLNISRQQVYRAIKRYESGISHKQQLGAGRPRILTLCHCPLTND